MLVTSGFANFVSHLKSAMTGKADGIMMEHFMYYETEQN